MIKITGAFAAIGLICAVTVSPAEAHWRGGGHFHHFHHGHWGHHWGHWRHWGYRHHWSHWGYRHHWGWRHAYVVGAPRACPPGTHLGYLGRFCHPNR